MKERFIVCEGLDGAGKTTIIKEAIKKLDDSFIYIKGLKSNTFIGKIASKIPVTFTFLLELAWNTKRKIKPALKSNKIVFQDRYDLSLLSYVPKVYRLYNKLLMNIFKKFLLKPDVLIYFTVSFDERIKRLEQNRNKYHSLLIKNPSLIKLREKKYLELYDNFDGIKFKIDTKKKEIDETVDEFIAQLFKRIY